MQIAMQIKRAATLSWSRASGRLALVMLVALVCLCSALVEAGGKGKGEEDIIMYNGNIVMRGDKKGGSIVLANNHPHHEEIEFSPSFFYGDGHGHGGDLGGHGGFGRRRR